MADYLSAIMAIPSSSDIRSSTLAFMIASYDKADAAATPLRLVTRIPGSYTIIAECLLLVDAQHPAGSAPWLSLRAAFAFAYGISPRPGEYLDNGRHKPLCSQAASDLCVFWWGDNFYPITNVAGFPPGSPDAFSVLLDHIKNNPLGKAGPRSVACNPGTTGFCCVSILFDYTVALRPRPGTPFLSGSGSQVTWTQVRQILRAVALKLGLPADRLLPHSLRSAANSQLLHLSPLDRQLQGGYSTDSGANTYLANSVQHARRVQIPLYDPATVPTSHLRLNFTTPALPRPPL